MQRDPVRVPASRRSARAGFVLKLALFLCLVGVPLAVGIACSTGPSSSGGSEPTGTTRQALGTGPFFTTTPIAPIATTGGATVYYSWASGAPPCKSTSAIAAAQCVAQGWQASNFSSGYTYAVIGDDGLISTTYQTSVDGMLNYWEFSTHPCSYYDNYYSGYSTDWAVAIARYGVPQVLQCTLLESYVPTSITCATGYIDYNGTCTTPPGGTTNIALNTNPNIFKDTDAHIKCNKDPANPQSTAESGCNGSPQPDTCAEYGMCAPNADLAMVGLNLNDTPVGYKPQKGPDVHIRVSYNHVDTIQPTSPGYGNLGPRWTHTFNSYITDVPGAGGMGITRYAMGGGQVDYTTQTTGGCSGSGSLYTCTPEIQGGAVLTLVYTSSWSYILTMPDGSTETFGLSDGATSYPRHWYLTKVADPQGNALTLAYDASHRLKTITDAESRVTNYCYDPTRSNCSTYSGTSTLISQITDPFGRSAVFSYDSYGRLSSIEDVLGITSSFTYDGNPGADAGPDGGADPGDPYFIAELTTPYGNSTFTGGADFSQNTRWLELTDANGNTERVEYNQSNSAIGATESSTPSGITVENGKYNKYNTYYWDKYVWPTYGTGSGKDYTKSVITHWTLGAGGVPSGVIASVKKPLENRVYYTYPGQNTNAPDLVGSYDQPAAIGRVMDDASTQLSTFTYNSVGFPLTATDPLGRSLKYTYAANGVDLTEVQRQISSTPTYATLAQYTYNTQHEPLTYIDAAGQTWRYCYNSAGQLTQAVDPANYSSGSSCSGGGYGSVGTRPSYDGTGRLSSVTNAAGNTQVSYTYPGTCSTSGAVNCDLPTSITDSEGRAVSYSRDALDRVTTTTYPDGTTDVDDWTFQSGTYMGTPSLEVRKHTDRLTRVTTYGFDANRQLTSVTDPLSHTVSYAYFADGTLNTLTDQNSHVTTWAIDVQSRPTSKTFADSTSITYGYETTTSRLKTVTDALSQVKTYAYDEANEPTGISYSNSGDGGALASTPNVTWSYDTWYPRRTGMSDGNGSTTWSYVAVGTNGALAPLTETPPFSNAAITWAYDSDGRPNSLTVGGGTAETWSYDALGRATSHVTQQGTWTYAFLGQTPRPSSRTLGATGISTTWSYDTTTNDQRLIGITNAATGASPGPRSYTFGYGTAADGGGPQNPYDIMASSQTSGGNGSWASQTWANTYDNIDRLLTATGSTAGLYTYALDGPGNLTTWTATGGGSTSSPTYSNVNELTSGSHTYDNAGEETADSSRTYKYDAENRVIEIDYTGGSNKTTITYDGLGRRVQLAFYNGSTATTRFAWCGSQLCEERDGSDTILKRYYPEGEYTVSGTVKLVYMPDQLGSARDVVNVSGPSVVYSEDFTPYGAAASTSGTATDFGYAGLFADPNSSLLYSASRFLDPASGRWIHRDPIAENGGIDLFSYAGGNPVSNTDESGLKPIPGMAPTSTLAGAALGYLTAKDYKIPSAVIGGVIGFASSFVAPEDAPYLVNTAQRTLGIATVSSGTAAAGTAAYNLSSGRPFGQDVGQNMAIGFVAPLFSMDAFIGGSRILGSTAYDLAGKTVFSVYTGMLVFAGTLGLYNVQHKTPDWVGGSCPIPAK